jgi:hypothetical protein
MILAAVAPALLVVPLDGRSVRFGAPVPAAALTQGLRLEGRGALQWRRLPIGRPDSDPIWVELAISGPPGTVRVVLGGDGPVTDGRGPVVVSEQAVVQLPYGREETTTWHWRCGRVDQRRRLVFTAPCELDGESWGIGEARTSVDAGFLQAGSVLLRLPRSHWAAAGLLPPTGSAGAPAKALRRHVQTLLPGLRELPGARGAGDYGRSGGVVTNLEYDTTLGLLRAAMALADQPLLERAMRSACHLRDRDLDLRTGLAFPHGADHRSGAPEPGHCWLQGLLWVGLATADDGHLQAAQNLAQALAAHPPAGTGAQERLRDYAWPLYELEALLAISGDPVLARAADRLVASIRRRFDPVGRTFRFGEGEVGDGVYLERGWLVGGLLLPALRLHLQRRPDARLAEQVHRVQQALLERVGRGGPGLPTHWRIAHGAVFAEHREQSTAAAAFLLDAFATDDLQRLLRRGSVRAAIAELPSADDPDLATELSLLLRTQWLWR